MADPVIEPVTVSEVTSGDYEGTIFVGDSVDGIADGTLITGSGGADLDVMFVLVSGYLVSTLRRLLLIYAFIQSGNSVCISRLLLSRSAKSKRCACT